MVNRFTLLIILTFTISIAYSQNVKTYSLEQLQNSARENYPLLKQKQIYTDIAGNKVNQLTTNFFPQISVTGQATYQSEVTEMNIPIPGASSFKQQPDQYALGLEVKQNLFDYGSIKMNKKIELRNSEIQSQQTEIEMQRLKEKISQLYGNLFLQTENKKITLLRIAELEAKKKKIKSAVDNGSMLQSNYMLIESEYLTSKQRIDEINTALYTGYKTLSILTNQAIDSNSLAFNSKEQINIPTDNNRIEYKMFDLQKQTLQYKESILNCNNLPKLFLFARGYYGRPGFNFLNNDFRTYGLVGAGLNWNLSGYYTSSNDKKNINLNKDMIDVQRKLFDINMQVSITQQEEEIKKLDKLIALDQQIVQAKTEVRKAASSQFDNGIITSSDYLVELNAETQANYNLALHQIQLIMAKYNYTLLLGY